MNVHLHDKRAGRTPLAAAGLALSIYLVACSSTNDSGIASAARTEASGGGAGTNGGDGTGGFDVSAASGGAPADIPSNGGASPGTGGSGTVESGGTGNDAGTRQSGGTSAGGATPNSGGAADGTGGSQPGGGGVTSATGGAASGTGGVVGGTGGATQSGSGGSGTGGQATGTGGTNAGTGPCSNATSGTFCGSELDPIGTTNTRYFCSGGDLVAKAACPGKCSLGKCLTSAGTTPGSGATGRGCDPLRFVCIQNRCPLDGGSFDACEAPLSCLFGCDDTRGCWDTCKTAFASDPAATSLINCMYGCAPKTCIPRPGRPPCP